MTTPEMSPSMSAAPHDPWMTYSSLAPCLPTFHFRMTMMTTAVSMCPQLTLHYLHLLHQLCWPQHLPLSQVMMPLQRHLSAVPQQWRVSHLVLLPRHHSPDWRRSPPHTTCPHETCWIAHLSRSSQPHRLLTLLAAPLPPAASRWSVLPPPVRSMAAVLLW